MTHPDTPSSGLCQSRYLSSQSTCQRSLIITDTKEIAKAVVNSSNIWVEDTCCRNQSPTLSFSLAQQRALIPGLCMILCLLRMDVKDSVQLLGSSVLGGRHPQQQLELSERQPVASASTRHLSSKYHSSHDISRRLPVLPVYWPLQPPDSFASY